MSGLCSSIELRTPWKADNSCCSKWHVACGTAGAIQGFVSQVGDLPQTHWLDSAGSAHHILEGGRVQKGGLRVMPLTKPACTCRVGASAGHAQRCAVGRWDACCSGKELRATKCVCQLFAGRGGVAERAARQPAPARTPPRVQESLQALQGTRPGELDQRQARRSCFRRLHPASFLLDCGLPTPCHLTPEPACAALRASFHAGMPLLGLLPETGPGHYAYQWPTEQGPNTRTSITAPARWQTSATLQTAPQCPLPAARRRLNVSCPRTSGQCPCSDGDDDARQ
eukprot:363932-Chlamydomonas_euryale.AAC.2